MEENKLQSNGAAELRLLLVEDSEDDAMLLLREVKKGGYQVIHERVYTVEGMEKALAEKKWDIVISDYIMPGFSGTDALRILKEHDKIIPFILTSNKLSEEQAVDIMKKGANDFITKQNLSRLVPAIKRELDEAKTREKNIRIEEDLRKSNELLEKIFSITHIMYAYLDKDMNFIRVNDAYAKANQKDPQFFIGKNHFVLFPHEENEAIFRQVVKTGVPYIANAKPFSYPDHPEWGVTYWDWTLKPVVDTYGNVEGLVFSLLDVTERKRAEEALQLASSYNRGLIETSLDSLVTIDINGKITDTNVSTEKITGYSRGDLIGTRFADYFTEPEKASAGYQKVFKEGAVLNYELNIRHRDGHVTPVLYNASLYRSEDGKILGILAAARDVSESKAIEEKLRSNEALLNNVLETLPVGVWIVGKGGQILQGNPEAKRIWAGAQYVGTEQYGEYKGWWYDTGKKIEAQEWAAARAVQKGEVSINEKIEIECFDGTHKIILNSAMPLYDPHKEMLGAIIVNFDITNTIKMENELRANREGLAEAQRIAHIGSWDWDIENNQIAWSDETYHIFGLTPAQIKPSRDVFMSYVHTDDKGFVTAAIDDSINNGKFLNIDHRITLSDNKVKFIHTQAEIVQDKSGKTTHMVGTFQDITDRKLVEEELKRAKVAADAANKAKSEFLANMSHEIRTPMNSIIGMADLLMETNPTQEQRQYVEIFREAGEHLLSLINDILDLARVESGYILLEKVPFDIAAVINKVENIMSVEAHNKGLGLIFHIADDIPRSLIGDPNRLDRVMLNLVGNAVKFTEKGGIIVDISLNSKQDKEVELLFKVKDTGIGVPSDKQSLLFTSFTQIDASTTRKYGGTGLGLVISKKLVEMMGGRMWVESEAGKGSVFYFTAKFPVAQASAVGGMTEAKPKTNKDLAILENELKSAASSAERNILLVEDSEDNRQLIELYLKKLPYKIDSAENGAIAVEKYKKNHYSLVLMDIQMPVMDGYTATQKIREWEKENNMSPTPIVALTANAFKEDEEKSLKAGCTSYMSKPVHKMMLLEMVGKYASNQKP
jgi:PAS domain S-box-containing protein